MFRSISTQMFLVLLLGAFLVTPASADTIYVCCNGTGDYLTIQEGIDAAVDGDTVLVLDGTYTGTGNRDVDFVGRLITVRSENGPENCIIDCQGSGRGFLFNSGETADAVVDGFTIRNGSVGGDDGGGIYCDSSSPTVANCTFSNNSAYHGGGIENTWYSSPTIIGCVFRQNQAVNQGGGLHNWEYCAPLVVNCLFADNSAAQGGGLCSARYSDAIVGDCTFSGNSASLFGGAIRAHAYAHPTVTNSILWGNSPDEMSANYEISTNHSDVQGGYPGEGNIDADPLFVDAANGDYHLSAGSPCIDAGDNTAVPADTADLDNDGDTAERTPFDLAGDPRFVDDPDTPDTGVADPPDYPEIVDMGAYEFQSEMCFGDLDGDGDIDLSDLAQLLANYGITSGAEYEDGDLDGDGDVDLGDLAALLAVYGTTCP